ncbi:MAG: recombination protein O N-terminal domain-containing protein [Treponema sp.]|nr:recombination protein O N-terminal domain-containing protein [Treponema sp.]
MSRTAVYTGLVLRSRPSGESNSEITLLTAEEGLIRATVFGGAKSKLRAHCASYNSGQVWIYRSKAKDSQLHGFQHVKLSDFDVHSWRPGLRELYDRTMAAGALAETILLSHGGGGDWETALNLANETLDTLESANDEMCNKILVRFLWQWAGFLGIQPPDINLNNKSDGELKAIITNVLTEAIGKRLKSWEW